mmetsp:Transcript_5653/g.19786  ORF Transcript_5653/g.19786 Transcript_5653/m.19786 type:complete len:95 (+) Transcript_5653:1111-1395(+)
MLHAMHSRSTWLDCGLRVRKVHDFSLIFPAAVTVRQFCLIVLENLPTSVEVYSQVALSLSLGDNAQSSPWCQLFTKIVESNKRNVIGGKSNIRV